MIAVKYGEEDKRKNYFAYSVYEIYRRTEENGEDFLKVFCNFGKESQVKELSRLARILQDSRERGTQLWDKLAKEGENLWAERRRRATEKIRLVDSKMSFPPVSYTHLDVYKRQVIKCCNEMKTMLMEFPNFKHSKKLHDHIVNINTLEEDADQLFISSMRNLHTTCSDPVTIIVWREIYIYLEKCVDACEHVADTVESVMMKNS